MEFDRTKNEKDFHYFYCSLCVAFNFLFINYSNNNINRFLVDQHYYSFVPSILIINFLFLYLCFHIQNYSHIYFVYYLQYISCLLSKFSPFCFLFFQDRDFCCFSPSFRFLGFRLILGWSRKEISTGI